MTAEGSGCRIRSGMTEYQLDNYRHSREGGNPERSSFLLNFNFIQQGTISLHESFPLRQESRKTIASWIKILIIILFSSVLFSFSGTSYCYELTQNYLDGVKDYKKGDFPSAIEKFSQISDKGIKNPDLFYNLGNSYFKNNQVGYAILWYERALKMAPNDPDLKFNLSYARSVTKDAWEEDKDAIYGILFFWKNMLNIAAVQWLAIIFNAVLWIMTLIRLLTKGKIPKFILGIVACFAVVFLITALYNYFEKDISRKAIIVSDKVSIRAGFDDNSTELFILHAGTKVEIEKDQKDFFRIYFTKGKIGWLKKSDVSVI
jgi:tetratricopeptide (TPR) repeat protein